MLRNIRRTVADRKIIRLRDARLIQRVIGEHYPARPQRAGHIDFHSAAVLFAGLHLAQSSRIALVLGDDIALRDLVERDGGQQSAVQPFALRADFLLQRFERIVSPGITTLTGGFRYEAGKAGWLI
jgi:hypothetical protein